MGRKRNAVSTVVVVAALAVAMLALPASAAMFAWDGGGTDDNWTTAANWGGDIAPGTGNTVEIQFAGPTRLTPNVDTNNPWVVEKIIFNSGAGAFDIGGFEISLQGSGTVLQNNSSATQTLTSNLQVTGGGKTFTASSGHIVIDGNLDLQTSVTARGGRNLTVNGLISGASGTSIGRTDDGILKLTNAGNTFSGNPGISHGVLEIANIADSGVISAIGTGTAIRLGQGTWGPSDTGTLRYTGPTASTNRTIQMVSNGTTQASHTLPFSGRPTIEVTNPATTLTFNGDFVYYGSSTLGQWRLRGAGNGVITGDITTAGAELEKDGTGMWVLSGTNSYAGPTTVNDGILKLGSAGALGNTSGVTVASGATVDVNGFNAGKNFTIAGTGSSGQGALVNNGAGIQGNVGVTLAADASIGGTGGRFDIGIGRPLVGNGYTLTKTGAGTVPVRSAAGSFGAINVDEGTLYFETDQTGMGSTPITVASGATLGMYYTRAINAPVTLNGGTLRQLGGGPTTTSTWSGPFTVNSTSTLSTTGGNLALTGPISGAGGLDIIGPNMVTLSGTNSYAGPTTVTSGILKIGSAGSLGNTSGVTVASGATVDVNGFNAGKNLNIAGTGSSGQGALANSGGDIIGNVGVTLDADATIGVTGGRMDIGIGFPLVGNGFTLTKIGAGRLPVRSAAGSFGAIDVDEGTLYFESDQTGMGSTPITVASGATLGMYYTKAINAPVTLNGGTLAHLGGGSATTSTWSGAFTVNSTSTLSTTGGNLALTGPIGGAGGLDIIGPNTVTLSGTSSYAGATAVNSGILKIGSAGALGNTSGVTVASGATFDFNGYKPNKNFTIAGTGTSGQGALYSTGYLIGNVGVTLTADATIGVGGLASNRLDIGYGRPLVGNGFTLTKIGVGNLPIRSAAGSFGAIDVDEGTLYFESDQSSMGSTPITVASGATVGMYYTNTISAPVTLNGGTLRQLGGGAGMTSTWSGAVTVNSTSTFSTTGGNLALSGPIGGVGGLDIIGPNTVTVSGTSSYQGATTVSQGTLLVTGSIATSPMTTVAVGATLGGTGTIGPLTLNGILSPGLSPATLHAGDTTWNGGGSYLWEISDYDGTAGTDWDLLDVAGSLTLGATEADPFTITVSALPSGAAAGTLDLFDSFEIVRTTEGIVGFDSHSFVLDTSGINYGPTNYWTVTHEGNSVYLNYVPEPATLSLLGLGALGLLARRRRK